MAGITLSPSLLKTLDSLNQVEGAYSSAQAELQTGQTAPDPNTDAVAYFQATSLTGRAAQVLNYKSGIDQGVSSIDASLVTTSAVEGLLQQLQGVLEGAKGASLAARTEASKQFQAIGTQLSRLVQDGGYQGLNLLTSSTAQLTVQIGPQSSGAINVSGYDLLATAGGARALFTAAGAFDNQRAILFSNVVGGGFPSLGGFSALDTVAGTGGGAGTVAASVAAVIFNEAEGRLNNAINQLQSIAGSLGSYSQILQTRSLFQQSYATQLKTGAQRLTLADLNTAAAHSQASSLRIELGLQSAALEGKLRSSILQILHAPSSSPS